MNHLHTEHNCNIGTRKCCLKILTLFQLALHVCMSKFFIESSGNTYICARIQSIVGVCTHKSPKRNISILSNNYCYTLLTSVRESVRGLRFLVTFTQGMVSKNFPEWNTTMYIPLHIPSEKSSTFGDWQWKASKPEGEPLGSLFRRWHQGNALPPSPHPVEKKLVRLHEMIKVKQLFLTSIKFPK